MQNLTNIKIPLNPPFSTKIRRYLGEGEVFAINKSVPLFSKERLGEICSFHDNGGASLLLSQFQTVRNLGYFVMVKQNEA